MKKIDFRMTQFTGSSAVAERLAVLTHGKIKIEDAGFDWKVLGPDVGDVEYTAWQCDQDAYAASGQKCSAQSIMFIHKNWMKTDLLDRLEKLAARRKLDDLTVGPTLSVTNATFKDHVDKLLKIPGAKLLFGNKEIPNSKIPACYGSMLPTAVFVPLNEMLKPENYNLCTTEIFAPFQVITEFDDSQTDDVILALEKMNNHLTAAICSNDIYFQNKMLGATVNGTTYVGRRARTTGAPQNHWFGPSGDPRSAGIHTPEAVMLNWTSHREIIHDVGPIPKGWTTPKCT